MPERRMEKVKLSEESRRASRTYVAKKGLCSLLGNRSAIIVCMKRNPSRTVVATFTFASVSTGKTIVKKPRIERTETGQIKL